MSLTSSRVMDETVVEGPLSTEGTGGERSSDPTSMSMHNIIVLCQKGLWLWWNLN